MTKRRPETVNLDAINPSVQITHIKKKLLTPREKKLRDLNNAPYFE